MRTRSGAARFGSVAAATRMPGGNASEMNRHRRISRPGFLRSTWRTICRPSARSRRREADTRRATPRRDWSSHRRGPFLDAFDDVVSSHSSRAEMNGPSIEAGCNNRSLSCASARLRMYGSMSSQATFVIAATNRPGIRKSAASASAYNRSQRASASIMTVRVQTQPLADRASSRSRTVQRPAAGHLMRCGPRDL